MLYNNKHVFVLNESCQAKLISFCGSVSHSLIRKKEQMLTVVGILVLVRLLRLPHPWHAHT